MDVIAGAGDIFRPAGSRTRIRIRPRLWTEAPVRVLEDITLGVMVLTAAANFLIPVPGNGRPSPFLIASWPEIFHFLQPSDIDSAVMDWGPSRRARPRKKISCASLPRAPFAGLRFRIRYFSDFNPPEPHLVKFFMFSE